MTVDLLSAPARQRKTLEETAHRPWPLPERSWVQGQTWERLLFAHWRVAEEHLRGLMPPQVPIDTFDGSAWLGLTPFRVSGFRLRGLPPLPIVSSFLELNVRTYVTVDGKPGIWFFSLDCESPLAVEGARRTYRLPYYHARMAATLEDSWIDYACERTDRAAARPHVFRERYRSRGAVFNPEPASLEYFLTERYCLYTLDERQDLRRVDIHHPPWPLQNAEGEIGENSMPPETIRLPDDPPLLHYAERQDVVIWALEPVR